MSGKEEKRHAFVVRGDAGPFINGVALNDDGTGKEAFSFLVEITGDNEATVDVVASWLQHHLDDHILPTLASDFPTVGLTLLVGSVTGRPPTGYTCEDGEMMPPIRV